MRAIVFCVLILCLAGCNPVMERIEPQMDYGLKESYVRQLPSAFKPLSARERASDWGKEYLIGVRFAEELDLYQAMTAFRRAEILLPKSESDRKVEIQYYIMLSYYFGKRYPDVINTFEHSDLRYVTPEFSAYRDMMIILYESYLEQGNDDTAQKILRMIEASEPKTGEELNMATALIDGDSCRAQELSQENSVYWNDLIHQYCMEKKSASTAQGLNAVIPGSGYLYLGQKQSAFTAFTINALFIAAAAHFYIKGNIAAGAIFTSFEAGWYFGGIVGVGEETKLYNERLWEQKMMSPMYEEKMFPALMLRYGF